MVSGFRDALQALRRFGGEGVLAISSLKMYWLCLCLENLKLSGPRTSKKGHKCLKLVKIFFK